MSETPKVYLIPDDEPGKGESVQVGRASAEEFAVLQVLNASLADATTWSPIVRTDNLKNKHLRNDSVPVGSFKGPLKEGILVPASDADYFAKKLSATLITSGVLTEGDFTITQAAAPSWAQEQVVSVDNRISGVPAEERVKEGKVKLIVDVPDLSKVNVKAAVARLEADGTQVSQLMASAIERKTAAQTQRG